MSNWLAFVLGMPAGVVLFIVSLFALEYYSEWKCLRRKQEVLNPLDPVDRKLATRKPDHVAETDDKFAGFIRWK